MSPPLVVPPLHLRLQEPSEAETWRAARLASSRCAHRRVGDTSPALTARGIRRPLTGLGRRCLFLREVPPCMGRGCRPRPPLGGRPRLRPSCCGGGAVGVKVQAQVCGRVGPGHSPGCWGGAGGRRSRRSGCDDVTAPGGTRQVGVRLLWLSVLLRGRGVVGGEAGLGVVGVVCVIFALWLGPCVQSQTQIAPTSLPLSLAACLALQWVVGSMAVNVHLCVQG